MNAKVHLNILESYFESQEADILNVLKVSLLLGTDQPLNQLC